MSDLALRSRTALIYGSAVLLILGISYYLPFFYSLFFGALIVMGLRELIPLLESKGFTPNHKLIYLHALSFLSLHFLFGLLRRQKLLLTEISSAEVLGCFSSFALSLLFALLLSLGLGLLVFFNVVLRQGPGAFATALTSFFAGLYLSWPAYSSLILLYIMPEGWRWLLLAYITPWFTDSVAYFYGRKFGKHKVFPKLSPNKTSEGFWSAQLATAILYALVFPSLILRGSNFSLGTILLGAIIGFTIALGDQFGDLFASTLKRYFGVKDFGDFFPGHGGILDRFDSTFFTIPIALVWSALVTAIY